MQLLTVADGVDDVSDVFGGRQSGVAVGDDHVVLVGEAGDGRQHVAVEPRLGGHRQERDAGLSAFRRLVQRHLATVRVAVRQHDGDERSVRPPLAAQHFYDTYNRNLRILGFWILLA